MHPPGLALVADDKQAFDPYCHCQSRGDTCFPGGGGGSGAPSTASGISVVATSGATPEVYASGSSLGVATRCCCCACPRCGMNTGLLVAGAASLGHLGFVSSRFSSSCAPPECHRCFHNACFSFAANHHCQKQGGTTSSSSETGRLQTTTFLENVPISQWSSTNVLQWMAVTNLYAHAETFKARDIKGSDLVDLDKEKLTNMGIMDQNHQKIILACIDVLCHRNVTVTTEEVNNKINSALSEHEITSSANHHHLLEQSFPALLQCDKCQAYLRGLMHQGMLCQDCGLICHRTCAATGLPPCIVGHPRRQSRLSLYSAIFGKELSSQFSPEEQSAPTIVLRCIQEIELRSRQSPGVDLYQVYNTTTLNDIVLELRQKFSDDPNSTSLKGYEIGTIASVLKRYFRELPNPVIPVEFYERFMEAISSPNEDQIVPHLSLLVKELPVHHRLTLQTVMAHLCRLCQMNCAHLSTDLPTIFFQLFSHILMRPAWENIMAVVNNVESHIRVMELLLVKLDWGERLTDFKPPALPPRRATGSNVAAAANNMPNNIAADAPDSTQLSRESARFYRKALGTGQWGAGNWDNGDVVDVAEAAGGACGGACGSGSGAAANSGGSGDEAYLPLVPPPGLSDAAIDRMIDNNMASLMEAEWYWGEISKEDVNEKLKDAVDGTFIVRNASTKGSGEFTLTLRKGGSNKLIKIYHKNGQYGFSEPLQFNSVVELISYYRNVTLAQYNRALDVPLQFPISKFQGVDEEEHIMNVESIGQRLMDINNEYLRKIKSFDNYYEDYSKSLEDIFMKRQALDAFNETLIVFKEQQEFHLQSQNDALPHEKSMLLENYRLLTERTRLVQESKTRLDQDLKNQMAFNRSLDRELNTLKPEVTQLYKEREQLQMCLLSKGVKKDRINKLLQDSSDIKDITRESALLREEEMLPHLNEANWLKENCSRINAEQLLSGKPNGTFLIRLSRTGEHALSIVADGIIGHCLIHKTERGYGFAEPYNIHPSLKSLVLHYSQTSLEEHNNALRTTLIYPVFATS